MKTGVVIIGSGPAGLLLGHQLRAAGVDCIVVERQTRERVESRIRAGVLETVTTDLLRKLGLDQRLRAEGMVEDGFNLATDDRVIRIDIAGLTVPGGAVFAEQNIILAMFGDDLMPRFHAPKLFMGAAAVGPQESLRQIQSSSAERRLIERADQVILLVDSSKFQSQSGQVVCGLEEIDMLVTDRDLSEDARAMLREAKIGLLVAS